MRARERIGRALWRWAHKRAADALRRADPRRLLALGERRALAVFHRAARRVPAYRRLLDEHGVDPASVRTIEDFKARVPITDKRSVFSEHELSEVCLDAELDDFSLFYSSSGHSGTFSFGGETKRQLRRAERMVEFFLEATFGALSRKTLVINCLSSGVKVPTGRIPRAETSVRSDVVLALVEKFRRELDQFILIGESLFLKKVAEEGVARGIPWHEMTTHVVTGGEFIAENYRSYLAALLGVDFDDPQSGLILVSMGISEVATSLLREEPATALIRRAACQDDRLRERLFGSTHGACQCLMAYLPTDVYLETVPGRDGLPHLVVTTLDPLRKIPLVRYETGDVAELLSYERLAQTLNELGYGQLVPEWKLPLAAVSGRAEWLELPGGGRVSPSDVKEALFADPAVAWWVTGRFQLRLCAARPRVVVQLKRRECAREGLAARLSTLIAEHTGHRLDVAVVPCDEFGTGLELDYERKPRYVARGSGLWRTPLEAVSSTSPRG